MSPTMHCEWPVTRDNMRFSWCQSTLYDRIILSWSAGVGFSFMYVHCDQPTHTRIECVWTEKKHATKYVYFINMDLEWKNRMKHLHIDFTCRSVACRPGTMRHNIRHCRLYANRGRLYMLSTCAFDRLVLYSEHCSSRANQRLDSIHKTVVKPFNCLFYIGVVSTSYIVVAFMASQTTETLCLACFRSPQLFISTISLSSASKIQNWKLFLYYTPP